MVSVSVIMATYNNERDIPLALASVLSQSYEDLELIVVNDASTDGTPEILEKFAAQDNRVKLLHNDKNKGRALSRNRAIENANGQFVAILDADDVAMPNRVHRQVAYMQEHPQIGILGSWAVAIDEANQILEPIFRPTSDSNIRRRFKRFSMAFIHSTVMFRRDVLMQAGLYDPRFIASQDFHLCYRVVQEARAAALPEYLSLYRIHTAITPAAIRTRYYWAARSGWNLFPRSPTVFGLLNLLRFHFLSILPGSVIKSFSGIYKHQWRQELLSEEEVSDLRNWLAKLMEQDLKTIG